MIKTLSEQESYDYDQRNWLSLKKGDLISFNLKEELQNMQLITHYGIVINTATDVLSFRKLNTENCLHIADGHGINWQLISRHDLQTINIIRG